MLGNKRTTTQSYIPKQRLDDATNFATGTSGTNCTKTKKMSSVVESTRGAMGYAPVLYHNNGHHHMHNFASTPILERCECQSE